ncbi:MAG: alpha/beta hydrolase [Acidimicrobiia bacterium]|nr:alpha/beta hydrolase [Acidimicrobiia bacterium]
MRTVVLVHGAWHGAWCWASVLAGLDERAVPAIAVDLPGHGASTEPFSDLHGDAAHVTEVLDAIQAGGAPGVVLVGHSYGGAVITEAGTHPVVDRLVYIAAFPPDQDETVLGLALAHPEQSELGPAMRFGDDGTSTVDPALAGAVFYEDCAPDDVERAVGLLGAHPMRTFDQPPAAVAWRARPTTYVVCGADRAVVPGLQRELAARIPAAAIVEWPDASHSPFLSQPGDVVDLVGVLA